MIPWSPSYTRASLTTLWQLLHEYLVPEVFVLKQEYLTTAKKNGFAQVVRTLFLQRTLQRAVWETCLIVYCCSLYIVDVKTKARVHVY